MKSNYQGIWLVLLGMFWLALGIPEFVLGEELELPGIELEAIEPAIEPAEKPAEKPAPKVETETPKVEIPQTEKTVPAETSKPVSAKESVPEESPAEAAEAIITADLLLPETTCAYISIRDFVHFYQSWTKTELGKFFATPEMEKVTENITSQIQGNFNKMQERLGVTLKELRQIAAGEISAGILLTEADQYAVVAIMDVRDHQVETQKVLAKISDRVLADGGKLTKQTILDAEVFFLDIPDKELKDVSHKAIYVLQDNVLIISDKREVIQGVLKRLATLKSETEEMLPCLADVDGYLNVLENCVTAEKLPDVVWYLDPIRFATTLHLMAAEADPNAVRGRSIAEMMTASGFDGIEAVGGVMTLRNEGYDGTHQTFLSIPKEPQGSLKMLKFPITKTFEIPEWISATACTVHCVNIDFMNIFDNLGPMFNQFFGEGDSNVWDDVLAGLEEDPYGPQISLRNDLFAHFKNNLLCLVQNDRPKDLDGERRLIAIPLKDDAKMRDAMNRLLSEEPMFETVKDDQGRIVWRAVSEEEGYEEEEDTGDAAPRREMFFPEMGITVWNGYLLIASHVDFLDTIRNFDPKKDKPLVDTVLYKQIEQELRLFTGDQRASIHYFNTTRSSQHLYEMFKVGDIPRSSSLEARRINQILSDPKDKGKKQKDKVPRKALLDASGLPEYESVKSYFLPAGATLLCTEKGFLFKGFWLSRERQDALNQEFQAAEPKPVDAKKPTEKSIKKPAEKSAEKPVEKSAEKSAEKVLEDDAPLEQPAEIPAEIPEEVSLEDAPAKEILPASEEDNLDELLDDAELE